MKIDKSKAAARLSVPAPGAQIRIARPGFETVQTVLVSTDKAVFCTGGWRLVPSPDGWRWDVDSTDHNRTTITVLPEPDKQTEAAL